MEHTVQFWVIHPKIVLRIQRCAQPLRVRLVRRSGGGYLAGP